MRNILIILAGLIALSGYIPYTFDILKGRARPARVAHIMFVFLLFITTLQQFALHSGSLITFTVGELIGSVAILLLAVKYGIGSQYA